MQAGKGSKIQIHAVGIPTLVEVLKTLEVAQKNPGSLVVLLWSSPDGGKDYELCATIPVARARVGATPMAITTIPELSLTYKTSASSHPTLVWNQTSADAKVVHHLVKREMGGPSNAFMAFDDDDSDEESRITGGNRAPHADENGDSARTSGVRSAAGTGGIQPIDITQNNAAVSMKLEGNLGEIDLSNLLQSIAMCKMTGCMKVVNEDVAASLFMDKGTPTHAYAVGSKAITASGAEIEGSDALLEMLLMHEGVFQFHPQQMAMERTVPKPLQMYLLEGAALRDHNTQLKERGITGDTVFNRAHKNLEYAAFKSTLMEGIPASMPIQKHLYQLSDGKISLSEILRKQPLKKSEWVPALYNLLQCGLLQIRDVQAENDASFLSTEAIEKALKFAHDNSVNPENGLVPYPLFLQYVEQEFARSQSRPGPFALMIFEAWLQTASGAQLLSPEEQKLMSERVHTVLNKYDQLGSFMEGAFALLLPLQDAPGAALTAQKLMDVIGKTKFERTPGVSVKVMIGISGVPDIARDILSLLKTANDAKNVCKKTGANIYTHKNLSSSHSR